MLQPVSKTTATRQSAPKAPVQAKAASPSAGPVDLASFRILPVAGAPLVSAEDDATLGNTGLVPAILNKLQGLGPAATHVVGALRFFSRIAGPGAYLASAYMDAQELAKALPDKRISRMDKGALVGGTGLVSLGALAALFSALPAKLIARFGLGAERLIQANKASGIAGGLAGMGFATVNLLGTCHDPKSSSAQRAFAKLGFGLGALGFVTGSAAMLISMGVGGGAGAALVPLFSNIATFAGLVSMGTWAGQSLLGKNTWLNEHLRGTFLG